MVGAFRFSVGYQLQSLNTISECIGTELQTDILGIELRYPPLLVEVVLLNPAAVASDIVFHFRVPDIDTSENGSLNQTIDYVFFCLFFIGCATEPLAASLIFHGIGNGVFKRPAFEFRIIDLENNFSLGVFTPATRVAVEEHCPD